MSTGRRSGTVTFRFRRHRPERDEQLHLIAPDARQDIDSNVREWARQYSKWPVNFEHRNAVGELPPGFLAGDERCGSR